jgi:hypothetical protein
LSLQKTGEMEDAKAIEQGKRANESRKTMKEFRERHGQALLKGQDPRSHETLLQNKKNKL